MSSAIFVLVVLVSFVALWVGLRVVGTLLEKAKCASCGYYRPREYMTIIRLDNGRAVNVCDEPGRCLSKIEISKNTR